MTLLGLLRIYAEHAGGTYPPDPQCSRRMESCKGRGLGANRWLTIACAAVSLLAPKRLDNGGGRTCSSWPRPSGGAETRHAGYEQASGYVASQFDRLKLSPEGPKGYFQPVPMQVKRMDEAQSRIELGG